MKHHDVLIIGAGAAGLMCAIEAGKRGRKVLVLDQAAKPAEKIRISGGGRCNFTNIHTAPDNYLSRNPRFCISALKRYTQYDFLDLVERHRIPWHEKILGQLFCDNSAQDIINMLLAEAEATGVVLQLSRKIHDISHSDGRFQVRTDQDDHTALSLVIATGGPSIPKMGSSGFGYELAKKFGLGVITPKPALVPLTFSDSNKELCKRLSGLSTHSSVSFGKARFTEGLLFTHRGLSGPSILQISSYWQEGRPISIDLCPELDVFDALRTCRKETPRQDIKTALGTMLPARLAEELATSFALKGRLADLSDKILEKTANTLKNWQVTPVGTEGYRTAEVTLGGVDTDELSSKTMEAKKVPGLFFIGEVIDVTGHLGGYNFQWAWSSGYAAGQAV